MRHSRGSCREPSRVYVDAVSGKDGRHSGTGTPSSTTRRHDSHPAGVLVGPRDRTAGRCWRSRSAATPGAAASPRLGSYRFPPDPPVVHFLAAATGKEEHTIAGLSWPKTADLDGDGLADLWGSVDGKLRALSRRAARGVACS